MKIELTSDQTDHIIISTLKSNLLGLMYDLEYRIQGVDDSCFHKNRDDDIKALEEHIEAIKLLLKYYGVQVE